MTKMELFTAVVNCEALSAEVRAKAQECIDSIKASNAKRATKPTKTQIENEAFYPSVLAVLNEETPTLSTAVATALEISTSKATGLLGNLFKEGKVSKVDVSVKGKGKQKGWLLVVNDTDLPADEQVFIGETH